MCVCLQQNDRIKVGNKGFLNVAGRKDRAVVFKEEEDEGRGVSPGPFSSFIIYFLINCDQNIDGRSSAAELDARGTSCSICRR